jgi:hypothetical protein
MKMKECDFILGNDHLFFHIPLNSLLINIQLLDSMYSEMLMRH